MPIGRAGRSIAAARGPRSTRIPLLGLIGELARSMLCHVYDRVDISQLVGQTGEVCEVTPVGWASIRCCLQPVTRVSAMAMHFITEVRPFYLGRGTEAVQSPG